MCIGFSSLAQEALAALVCVGSGMPKIAYMNFPIQCAHEDHHILLERPPSMKDQTLMVDDWIENKFSAKTAFKVTAVPAENMNVSVTRGELHSHCSYALGVHYLNIERSLLKAHLDRRDHDVFQSCHARAHPIGIARKPWTDTSFGGPMLAAVWEYD